MSRKRSTVHREFLGQVDRALGDAFLQKALINATGSFKDLRSRAVAELPGFEELRRRAKAAKDRVLDNLGYYLTQFESRIAERGGRVHWAETGGEAVEIVLKIARDHGVKKVVKGKSMLSEEIHLNAGLESAGLEVFETDLGEYILQLAGEKPSHILVPAVHKTRENMARLLQDKLGLAYDDHPETMTQSVRRVLRSRFLEADMGITGANFGVAETGTIVLFENEGNIRMSTTFPKVHVAVMGLEKLTADWDDLADLITVLPLSATGQRSSSYVSFLTGPGRTAGEGPEALHVVLVDGFRTKVLADPVFRQVLRCLRCGACLNHCPAYRKMSGHLYPWVYSGPIGVVLTGAAFGPEAAADVAGASTLCRACADVCPVMIDLPDLIVELRRRLAQGDRLASSLVRLLARSVAGPLGFDLAGRAMSIGTRIMAEPSGRVRDLPSPSKSLGRGRRMIRPAAEPFHRSMFPGEEP